MVEANIIAVAIQKLTATMSFSDNGVVSALALPAKSKPTKTVKPRVRLFNISKHFKNVYINLASYCSALMPRYFAVKKN